MAINQMLAELKGFRLAFGLAFASPDEPVRKDLANCQVLLGGHADLAGRNLGENILLCYKANSLPGA